MASNGGVGYPVVLPNLYSKPRFYPLVPRRYEETKPAVAQSFTHGRILDLGNVIHRQTLDQCQLEKEEAVKAAREEVWEQAEINKREALDAALCKARAEHEKVIRKLQKTHERAIREEALRVEGEMQKLAISQVKAEREAGEVRLRQALLECEQMWKERLEQAVAKAREEERQYAASQAAAQAKEAKEKYDTAVRAAADEKSTALQQLEAKKTQEREVAVSKAHQDEKEIAAEKLAKQSKLYEQQITVLHTHIGEAKQATVSVEKALRDLQLEKEKVEMELRETWTEFQEFIKMVRPYQDCLPAEFVLPPLQSLKQT